MAGPMLASKNELSEAAAQSLTLVLTLIPIVLTAPSSRIKVRPNRLCERDPVPPPAGWRRAQPPPSQRKL